MRWSERSNVSTGIDIFSSDGYRATTSKSIRGHRLVGSLLDANTPQNSEPVDNAILVDAMDSAGDDAI
jgi:hypothetical protein